ncbi:MAG: DUF1285 domain-containing protein [Pseudomonadota bacterium]
MPNPSPPKTPDTAALAQSVRSAGVKGPPPVHLWNPPFCGDLDIRIASDGTWFYLGTPIGRPALVRLFASILKLEEGRYYLVTPVEKVGIRVDDAPFVAVDVSALDAGPAQRLQFETNVGDIVTAGPDHAIRVVRDAADAPRPYIHIRRGLEALIDRKSYYRLADLGEIDQWDGRDWFGVRSEGTFFPIQPADEVFSD